MKNEILAEMKLTFRAVFWVRNPRSLSGLVGLGFDALVLAVIAYGLWRYSWQTLFVLLVFFVLLPVFVGALATLHHPLGLTSLGGRIVHPIRRPSRAKRPQKPVIDASASEKTESPTPTSDPKE